jgi:hypothetical protein
MPVTGEASHKAEDFDLPVQDVQKVRRNFPGYEEKKYYSLAEIQDRGWKVFTGTTDTDSVTGEGSEPEGNEEGYSKIYQKKGLPRPRKTQTDSPVEKANLKPKTMKENWSSL